LFQARKLVPGDSMQPKRSGVGIAIAILVAVAVPVLLLRAAETWSLAGSERYSAGIALWLLASAGLAGLTVILGKTIGVTVQAAGGVTVLGISLGAVLQASGDSVVAGAYLVITLAVVVMAAAATRFHDPAQSRERAAAVTFWLLDAGMLAGATWTCVFGD
jgi:hypothetical protein